MSGECEKCGEHCLECTCKQKRPESVTDTPPPFSRPFPPTKGRFAIIGGDIHQRISRYQLDNLQKAQFVPWWVDADKGYVWIPVPDEKADGRKGKWVWIEFGHDHCEQCRRKFFYKTIEG